MSEHTSFSECKYPQIYEIFFSTDYFGDETVICSCIRKECVYSREWDYEYNEYYSRTIGGIFTALAMFENTIRDPQDSSLSDELKQKIGSVEFLPDNNDHDCLNCFCQVMENHLALDLLDLVPVFSRLQFLSESPFEQ